MPPEDPGATKSPLDLARRRVAATEARLARQLEILRQIDGDKNPDVEATAQQLLITMETTLSVMRDHLQFEEQRETRRTSERN
jgi:hypothetical protein